MTNKKKMRIAGFLQIIVGAASILLTWLLISKGDVSAANVSGEKALGVLVATYALATYQIFAGIIGGRAKFFL